MRQEFQQKSSSENRTKNNSKGLYDTLVKNSYKAADKLAKVSLIRKRVTNRDGGSKNQNVAIFWTS